MTDILLADIGGTHARLAVLDTSGTYKKFQKYRLDEFSAFSEIIHTYQLDAGATFKSARFSMARTPVDRVISYKRFAGDPDYKIDFNELEKEFGWSPLLIFNDLEAAAMGLSVLPADSADLVVSPQGGRENAAKVLVSVGTGVGHAYVAPQGIFKTHGGHFIPPLLNDRHHAFMRFVAGKKADGLSLIAEDFVSSRGLVMAAEFVTGRNYGDAFSPDLRQALRAYPEITRLFFQALGVHAHILVSATGFYGGVYITGGVIDHLVDGDFADWQAFQEGFYNKMVSVVDRSLRSTPVYYVRERELPLLGLSGAGQA